MTTHWERKELWELWGFAILGAMDRLSTGRGRSAEREVRSQRDTGVECEWHYLYTPCAQQV